MNSCIVDSLDILEKSGKLNKMVVLWGIGSRTTEVLEWFNKNGKRKQILAITDNFKCTFFKEYEGISVVSPRYLIEMDKNSIVILLAVNYSESIKRQLEAYEISEVYNLQDLSERRERDRLNIPYNFIDRRKIKKNLCYILAGYEAALWENTLARISVFKNEEIDYCIVSSGKYDERLDKLAEEYDWSYLYTEQNQVCYIQNLVIELHPEAEYIIKIDEDIFIGKDFFTSMLHEFHRIEEEGEYRIGFAVPVIPLNCCGYVSYLKLAGEKLKEEYEKQFGRAFKSRFSAVFSITETAEFLWETIDCFDTMVLKFLNIKGYDILDCYFNIGCIMFTRERWMMMGRWPENLHTSGMGEDEEHINRDNSDKDMAIYEIQSVLAGHLAFGHQKQKMYEYYFDHLEKFRIKL